ncbi:ABC transporter substrate-binding protein [Mycoavidus sp. HKI]|uniref:ABC transporter substrate-binding protein n=1 Tax=Mycoavidus sp. HKI TaxID=2840467 RepID=UPI001CBD4A6B|nr:ABC transporter substrate-binding protein [Mycoavidus sp. HKI]UTU47253.1 ABC transporter substrate-binding protein [Mycoavidus sp. HKI]
MDDQNKPNNNRRNMIKAVAAAGITAASIPFIMTSRKINQKLTSPKNQEIVIRTSGGKSHIAYTKILFEPFTQETGIKVTGIPSNVEPIAEIKTMVKTGTYHWNMACLGSRAVPILSQLGYLEPHKLEDDNVVKTIMPQALSTCGVGMNVYSTVLAYRTDVFKGRSMPRTWGDFWNVEKFPGLRGLRQIPFDTIEEALMADGVAPSEVYSCVDAINRAFRSLDRIKSHVPIWWQNAPQAEHLLKAGEVHLIPAFSTSVISAMEAGAPVTFSWDQHIYAYDNWTILKETPNVDACRQFIQFATAPERQARLIPYGIAPTQPAALEPSILKKKQYRSPACKATCNISRQFKKRLA